MGRPASGGPPARGCPARTRSEIAAAPAASRGPRRWRSFWDLASADQGAAAMTALYGEAAAAAAAACIGAARADDRDVDARFWAAVPARVRAAKRRREAPVPS